MVNIVKEQECFVLNVGYVKNVLILTLVFQNSRRMDNNTGLLCSIHEQSFTSYCKNYLIHLCPECNEEHQHSTIQITKVDIMLIKDNYRQITKIVQKINSITNKIIQEIDSKIIQNKEKPNNLIQLKQEIIALFLINNMINNKLTKLYCIEYKTSIERKTCRNF